MIEGDGIDGDKAFDALPINFLFVSVNSLVSCLFNSLLTPLSCTCFCIDAFISCSVGAVE